MTTRAAMGLVVLGVSSVAQANTQYNGPQINGAQINGAQINGTLWTGTANIIGASPSCAHSEGVAGGPLTASCSPCAQHVSSYDGYCTTWAWDSICVNEANADSQCTAHPINSYNLIGATFTATVVNADNSTSSVTMQIANVRWNGRVYAHTINYWVPGHYFYYAGRWYYVPGSWNAVCNSYSNDTTYGTDSVNYYNEAVLVPGTWETRTGVGFVSPYNGASYRGGGRIPGSTASAFSFACRDVGAIAKCSERDGYMSGNTKGYVSGGYYVTSDSLHQACVRMTRADYCGDGLTWTTDGMRIDVYDGPGIQTAAGHWAYEATWTVNGASNVGAFRQSYYGSIWYANPNSFSLTDYMSTHPYCTPTLVDDPSAAPFNGANLINDQFPIG